jgi:hypothetical protein
VMVEIDDAVRVPVEHDDRALANLRGGDGHAVTPLVEPWCRRTAPSG